MNINIPAILNELWKIFWKGLSETEQRKLSNTLELYSLRIDTVSGFKAPASEFLLPFRA